MTSENSLKEKTLKSTNPSITRVKLTTAGFIVEVNETGQTKESTAALFKRIASTAWDNYQEIVYAFYGFSSDDQRFGIEAILREKQTVHEFNMSTSYLGENDIFCRFTRFDFDVLTLSDRDEESIGLFVIDDSSPCKVPQILYSELDIHGHQFSIKSKAEKLSNTPNVYSIKLLGGDQRY